MKELLKALSGFQQEVPVIHKGEKGYNYTYANLPSIFEVINPLLKKYGLCFTQLVGEDKLKTIVYHVDTGQSIESDTKIPTDSLDYVLITKKDKEGNEYDVYSILGFEGMNKAQAYGSLITYFRRYALSSILGLITDKDNDASGDKSEEQKVKQQAEKPWLNRFAKDGKTIRQDYVTIVKEAIKKGLDVKELRNYYAISKNVESYLINDLKNGF